MSAIMRPVRFNGVQLHMPPRGGTYGGTKMPPTGGAPKMPLTDIICKNAKPETKSRKIADEKGLYFEVMPSGSKYFRMRNYPAWNTHGTI